MTIEFVFILSQLGDLIALRTYKGQNRRNELPEFYLQFTRRFKGNQMEKEYPLIRMKDSIWAFINSVDIIIGAVTTEDMPILQLYSSLFHLADVLKGAYSDNFSAERLKANASQIELMLDSFMDYGIPLIPQKFVLESIAKPSGMMEKIEEAIVGRRNVQKDQLQTLEKYLESVCDVRDHAQYRISDIKGDDEILFDVIEYLDCVVDKNGKYIVEEINGEIKVDCNLSGTPELFVFLNQPQQFNDYSIHECLFNRIDTFEREKVLNFIPPTGNTTLFYYNIKGISVRVPFDFIPRLTINDNSVQIEIKLLNRPVKGTSYKIEELNIKLIIPNDLVLGQISPTQGNISQLENALLWKIGKLEVDQSIKLSANYTPKNKGVLKSGNFIACIKFQINQYSCSGTKIDKVEVRNGAKNLVKKARNVSKSGYYEIRLN